MKFKQNISINFINSTFFEYFIRIIDQLRYLQIKFSGLNIKVIFVKNVRNSGIKERFDITCC